MNIHQVPKVARPWILIQNIANTTENYDGKSLFLNFLMEFLDSRYIKRLFNMEEILYREQLLNSLPEKYLWPKESRSRWKFTAGHLFVTDCIEKMIKFGECPEEYQPILEALKIHKEYEKTCIYPDYCLDNKRCQYFDSIKPNTKIEILYNFCKKQ